MLLCPCDSLGKDTRVDCHFHLVEIFLAQGLNLHLQQVCFAGRFLTTEPLEQESFLVPAWSS